tara:strand:- start:64939 stop:66654 length:1716 start_codon:yes stop_codon:yes gene_type:complete
MKIKALITLFAMTVSTSAMAQAEHVDLILHNGQVITVDEDFRLKTAVAVRDEHIVAVGGEDLLQDYDADETIDLAGRTLMPGFTDTHVHPMAMSPRDIRVSDARSIAEVQDMLRAKAAELGPGEWITGMGWQESNLAENRVITRADLDVATPDNPVMLVRAGGHSSVSNSLALEIAGVDSSTPQPPAGLIEYDESGEPNGIIRERYQIVGQYIPDDDWADMRPGYIAWLQNLLSLGITSFFNASGSIDDEPVGRGGTGEPTAAMTFRRAREIYEEHDWALPRMTMYINYPGAERLAAFGHATGYGDEYVRIGPIGETAVDGGFTGPTAWLLADYKGQPGFRAEPRFTDAEFQEIVDTSARLGWQMGVHAIGDAAIVQAVDAYSRGLRAIPSEDHAQDDRRWFLDHFTIMPPNATMDLMRQDNIMIAQQPNFLYNLEDRYNATLDDWRLAHNNAISTPVKKFGLFMAFGSDNLPISPFIGLYSAILRRGPSGAVYGPEEAVTRAEAIRMYTANGPYLSWEEDIKGTIEPGKLADMIVLPFDPLTATAEEIRDGVVDMTFLGGKLVYERSGVQ